MGSFLVALPPVLYSIGFGYALLGLNSLRYPYWLHFGAVSLLVGVALDNTDQSATVALLMSVAGASSISLTMWLDARRSESGFQRLALLVAGVGPWLIALHASLFTLGSQLLQARFLRLGATAAMTLPLLAALYWARAFDDRARSTRIAKFLLATGVVAMPLVLTLSAFVDPRLKYALGPASDCFTLALLIACFQSWKAKERVALVGFSTILGSMLLGKLMGAYAFDGPLAAPSMLTDYADTWRVSLRNFHIDLMVLGFALFLWPGLVRPRTMAAAGFALALGLCVPAMGDWSRLAGGATLLWLLIFWTGRVIE